MKELFSYLSKKIENVKDKIKYGDVKEYLEDVDLDYDHELADRNNRVEETREEAQRDYDNARKGGIDRY